MKVNCEDYSEDPPPESSPQCALWVDRIKAGWRPNGRIRGMGYSEKAEFFGVYIWEYFNVIRPLLDELKGKPQTSGREPASI